MTLLLVVALNALAGSALLAQLQTGTLWREDFQSYGAQSVPVAWRHYRVGVLLPSESPSFRITEDPLASANLAYRSLTQRQHIVVREGDETPGRAGNFSLFEHEFFLTGRHQLRGRIMASAGLGGITFLSSYPARDRYYLIGAWPRDDRRPLRLFAHGGADISGTLDSGFALEPNRWHQFRIELADQAGGLGIRARFWLEGTPEPSEYAIDAVDRSITRPRSGRVGVWAAGGGVFFDDLALDAEFDPGKLTIQVLESGFPTGDGAKFNRDVAFEVRVLGPDAPTATATLDGIPYVNGTVVTAEGTHTLLVEARNAVGETASARVGFLVDKTPPRIRFTSHQNESVLRASRVIVTGNADDAVQLMINSLPAVIDAQGRFISAQLPLQEGRNTLVAFGIDAVGNAGRAELVLIVDTGAVPQVSIASPLANACLDATSLSVSGKATAATAVTVTFGGVRVPATMDPGGWQAVLPGIPEHRGLLIAEARNDSGGSASASVLLTVDRTPPVIEVSEGGAPFVATAINRAVAPFVRVIDIDPGASLIVTKGGAPFVSGASISVEGLHRLDVVARDCAGHETRRVIEFTIDLTPPTLQNLTPADDTTVSTSPLTIRGTTSPDVTAVEIADTAVRGTPDPSGSFVLTGVPLAEGMNRFTVRATDRAGNVAESLLRVRFQTRGPGLEILVAGSVLVPGSVFNRAVEPVIRSFDSTATVTATLNGSAFPSGTRVSADGSYELIATATDSVGNSTRVQTNFVIDATAPVVKITAPSGTVTGDRVDVSGTAADSVSVLVNGIPARLENGNFIASGVPLEFEETIVDAVGYDRAGNTGRDSITVRRQVPGPAILILHPTDGSLTNRAVTEILGQVLTDVAGSITIGSTSLGKTTGMATTTVPVDATGRFQLSDFPLGELENAITATATSPGGNTSSAVVRVMADFTPPAVTILESGQPFGDGARVPERALLSLDVRDPSVPLRVEMIIDGTTAASFPAAVTAPGGHTIVAIARDAAGNQTRIEQSFFVGTGAGGCALGGFDPPDGAVVAASSFTLVGLSGGAAGVQVNGVAASVASGSFCATIELPAEGPNAVTVTCTDTSGSPTGTPAILTLVRMTGDPALAIDSPPEGSFVGSETIDVRGTAGSGVLSAEVNGAPATVGSGSFTAPGVRLNSGLNIITARARNSASRSSISTRRIIYIKDAPTITVTSPGAGSAGGAQRVDVSGTWTNLDPATIAVNGPGGAATTIQSTLWSDASGSFRAVDVPLIAGTQTLTVTAQDRLNRVASTTVVATYTPGAPSVEITQPQDHQAFGSAAADSFEVRGSFRAQPGATVEVNGVVATIDAGSSTFVAPVRFSTSAPMTPVVARVTEPGGAAAIDTVRVTKFVQLPRVFEAFPAPEATEVDASVLITVLFSTPMSRESLATAFRLEQAGGTPVSGVSWLDRDLLMFAPGAPLTPGERYTIRITTAATDPGGNAPATEFVSHFTVARAAASNAPVLEPVASPVCAETVTIRGRAAPLSRLRLEAGQLILATTADGSGSFSFQFPTGGRSGCQVARIRSMAADGSLSAPVEARFFVDCAGPGLLSAQFDRTANRLELTFSKPIKASTVCVGSTCSIRMRTDDGSFAGGTADVSGAVVSVTPSADLRSLSFTLTVTTAVEDLDGRAMRSDFTQRFSFGTTAPQPGNGSGFISGEVFDATSGRPYAGATVTVEIPSSSGSRSLLGIQAMETLTATTDERGRYTLRLPEGAHTIRISAPGFAPIWRQVIVPAGGGVVPVDIRIPERGISSTSTGAAITLVDGAETPVTGRVELTVPASALTPGQSVSLTSVGAQELAGLLPLGWSPLAAAAVETDAVTLAGAQLLFTVPYQQILSASQTITAIRYDQTRDEWSVTVPAVNVGSDGRAPLPIDSAGSFALVYPDKGPRLAQPPAPVAGGVLVGVADGCAGGCQLVARTFSFDPPVIPPTGRSVATLIIEGSDATTFPSGTPVQAYIDEELRLADGTRMMDPPYATDVILYRTLEGDAAMARFHLAPSARAGAVILDVGFSRVRILPYPGRVDRGNLIGPEGGRAHDARVTVEIPPGAANEAIRAGVMSLSDHDLDAVGSIAGFRVLAGLQLELVRLDDTPVDSDGDGVPDAPRDIELLRPAHAVFTVDQARLSGDSASMIVVEQIGSAPFGLLYRLVAQADRISVQQSTGTTRMITRTIDRTRLPLDGIRHEGRYLLLAAESPIAFAFGAVRLGTSGAYLPEVRIHAPPLGVHDATRVGGFFIVPVPAKPAAPFSLAARHPNHGEAAPFTSTVAPDADAVINVGDLVFTVQPPTLVSTTPSDGATEVSLTTAVRATFSPAIDPSSVDAETLVVRDAESGAIVPGSVAAEGTAGVIWTLRPGGQLEANRRYVVTISRTLRGANGAALGETRSFGFATITRLGTTEVRRERIRITIPDANGISRVSGAAGALPPGWVAIAMRLGRDFITRYQAAAQADGSFSFLLGGGVDRIGIEDSIDLHIVNTAGNVAAIIPLTPFVSEDGRGFVPETTCRAKDGQCEPTRFTSADGISVTVPHGAFDAPTVVTVQPENKAAFEEVPAFDQSVNLASAVRLDFDAARANKPLEIELPVPAGLDTNNRYFILGLLGQSVRGPRVMAVDTLRVIDGKFTTESAAQKASGRQRGTQSIEPDANLQQYMLRGTRSGVYGAMDVNASAGSTFGWVMLDGLANGFDLFWSNMAAFYAADYYIAESRGRIVIPALTNTPFEIVGVDSSTGLQAFTRAYNPLAPGDPGATVSLPNPQQNIIGPYPAFGTPFRVELLDLQVENVDITSIRGYTVRLENGMARVTPASGPRVELLNVSRGHYANNGGADPILSVNAQLGDRIALLIPETNVDPNANLTLVFSEPIFTGPSTDPLDVQFYLQQLIVLETREPDDLLFTDVTKLVDFQVDSGGRRISMVSSAPWRRGNIYRLRLKRDLSDVGDGGVAGLKLLQVGQFVNGALQPVGAGHDLQMEFRIREPKGFVSQFNLRQSSTAQFGTVRDLALNGNILFVAAHEGGLLAYDVADPASLSESTLPLALVPGRDGDAPALTENWGVASDHHGRVYTTGITASFGILRSYRIEDFLKAAQTPTDCWSIPNTVCQSVGSTAVSWRIGATAGLPLSSATVVSDLPEALPRKLQITLQDNDVTLSGLTFGSASGAHEEGVEANGLLRYSYSAPIDDPGLYPYRIQRITVENLDLDMRWSGDARPGQPAMISGILVRPADRVRIIRNQRTWAVVSLFGYGISVMDLNALESNDQPNATKITERLALTRARAETYCFLPSDSTPCAIPSLAFSPEAIIRAHQTDLTVYGLDPSRGVLDVSIQPPFFSEMLGQVVPARVERAPQGLMFTNPFVQNGEIQHEEYDRIAHLRAMYENAPGNPEHRKPVGRFSSIARYSWRLEGEQNPLGIRGSEPGKTVTREYALIAGNDFGLLVVEIFGQPAPVIYPAYWGLRAEHLVDVIWIPGGAMSVRTVPRTNQAIVVDGRGEVLLVDLSRIDERWKPDGQLNDIHQMFPTAADAILTDEPFPDQVGVDDPRIIWRSGHFIGRQTVPPLIDPETGFVFAGTDRVMKVFSAADPRIQMKVDLGGAAGLVEVGGVVPLGIDPPRDIQKQIAALPPCPPQSDAPVGVPRCRENASLAAFRLEVTLPGGVADALSQNGQQLRVALENERVLGAAVAQTPAGFPRAHLRQRHADGSLDPRAPAGFTLQRLVPPSMATQLRHQRGFNKFLSPWIVAIADPRATMDYAWPQNTAAAAKLDAGCPSCDRPLHLRGKTEADGVYELWSSGRILLARPETAATGASLFAGTTYAYLGEGNRLVARFGTIIADTVRPTEALVAAQNPPVARGAVEETVYVHSGEVETRNTDLDAGGRADFNVFIDRTYRSRTLGGTSLGAGWDSHIFKRLRVLPSGDVEYRDGRGEVWLFLRFPDGSYIRPKGLFLNLVRSERGFTLTDQKWRVLYFDEYGRLTQETDHFYTLQGAGNVIRYLYDASGQLVQILDPNERVSKLSYFSSDHPADGLLREFLDWRGRKVEYGYSGGRLTDVFLPEVSNTDNKKPRIRYTYFDDVPVGSFNDRIELLANLRSIIDPKEAPDGTARINFTYGGSVLRDRIERQIWGTGEQASFTYSSQSTTVKDALGQKREYTLTSLASVSALQPRNYNEDRQHIFTLIEDAVAVVNMPYGTLPGTVTVGFFETVSIPRVFTYLYDEEGQLLSATESGIRTVKNDYGPAGSGLPGKVLRCSTTVTADSAPPPCGEVTTAAAAASDAIQHRFDYQPGSAFLRAVSANGLAVETPEAHRSSPVTSAVNDSITAQTTYDEFGRVKALLSDGGTDPDGAGAKLAVKYEPLSAPLHARSLPAAIDRAGLLTVLSYPDADTIVEIDTARGVTTTTKLDAWRRPVEVRTTGPDLMLEERYRYDATGRLAAHERKQGNGYVTTRYSYDVLGRVQSVTTDNVAVDGVMSSVTTTSVYNLTARKIETTLPGGAKVIRDLDPLGRAVQTTVDTGSSPIVEKFAYDIADHLAFHTDSLTATATAYDIHGRPTEQLRSDGTRSKTGYDAWGRPRSTEERDAANNLASAHSFEFTPTGRLKKSATRISEAETRETIFAWDGAGRASGVATGNRASHTQFDEAGRPLETVMGEGNAGTVITAFERQTITSHTGVLPVSVTHFDKLNDPVVLGFERNTLGAVTRQSRGGLEWKQRYDEAGNIVAAAMPHRGSAEYSYDARGAVLQETLPDQAANQYQYSAAGALSSYIDPVQQPTKTETDKVGRPLARLYADQTMESFEYDSTRLKSYTDRQNRTQLFEYNAKGQLERIRQLGGETLDLLEYDEAGRLTRWTNKDAAVFYGQFDLEGRPGVTRQTRYQDGTGLSSAQVLDEFTQEHRWNEHGERTHVQMPAAPSGWTRWLHQKYDAAGNLISIERVGSSGDTSGQAVLTGTYRGAGRLHERTVHAPGAAIVRRYGYDGSMRLSQMEAAANGRTVAGSRITSFDGVQIAEARLLGISAGARANQWEYDARSRVRASALGRTTVENLTAADFRASAERTPRLDQSTRAQLASRGVDVDRLDPPTVTATEQPGHKIDVLTQGSLSRPFVWNGAERRSDGQFEYEFDEKGRLILASGAQTRVRYVYDGNNRMVGRRVESLTSGQWQLAAPQLLSDGLPPDSTFVWDPISDRLIAVYEAGNQRIVRQIIHGDASYDDPLEVMLINPIDGSIDRLYPIFDEAGTGSLQAVLNVKGEVVARKLIGDAYGDDQFSIGGAAVDRVAIAANRETGEVKVTLRTTEEIKPETLAAGVRLSADGNSASVAPTLADAFTAQFAFTSSQWTTFVQAAQTLSIAVTKDLRASAWAADVPVLPAPDWALLSRPVFTSAELPVEVRESLASLSSWLSSIPANSSATRVLYEVADLALLGSTAPSDDPSRLLVTAPFHAYPFSDPVTGLVYARSRWYDPSTATFLSPDPRGYEDSSNMYIGFGADPVNNRDPLGEGIIDELRWHSRETRRAARGVGGSVRNFAVGTFVSAMVLADAGSITSPTRVQSQVQVVEGAIQTKAAVAQWGTSAGEALAEPELIAEALNTLDSDELAEVTFDAAITTSAFVTPAARAKVPGAAAPARISAAPRASSAFKVVASEPASITPSTIARSWQGRGNYPGVDRWRDITVKKGSIVYAGEPGLTGFFTTRRALMRAGTDATAVFEGMQVAPRAGLYRPGLTAFEVLEDTPAAFARTLANTQHGTGGLPQLYIPNFERFLRPVQTHVLHNRVVAVTRGAVAVGH